MSTDVATTPTTESLEADISSSAGALNLAHARLTRVAAVALRDELWGGTSLSQWFTYQAGITTSRADQILSVAEARDRFRSSWRVDAGELSLEQMVELVKAPPEADADIEHWGTIATPSRIRRSIKRRYGTPKPEPNQMKAAKPIQMLVVRRMSGWQWGSRTTIGGESRVSSISTPARSSGQRCCRHVSRVAVGQ